MKTARSESFRALWLKARSFEEACGLAGICDTAITMRAAARAFRHVPTQWEKFFALLKHRARLRYERGEVEGIA